MSNYTPIGRPIIIGQEANTGDATYTYTIEAGVFVTFEGFVGTGNMTDDTNNGALQVILNGIEILMLEFSFSPIDQYLAYPSPIRVPLFAGQTAQVIVSQIPPAFTAGCVYNFLLWGTEYCDPLTAG